MRALRGSYDLEQSTGRFVRGGAMKSDINRLLVRAPWSLNPPQPALSFRLDCERGAIAGDLVSVL